jgi:hypothetical protein
MGVFDMPIFGINEPVLVAILVLFIVLIVYVMPIIIRKKSFTDYSNFEVKNSNAFWHFAGVTGPSYNNVKLGSAPTVHADGRATIPLENLPNPLVDVNMNPMDDDCNVKVKLSSDLFFGTRVDVLCNIDANGHKREWDNVFVDKWDRYISAFKDAAKRKVLQDSLESKELVEELKGVQVMPGISSPDSSPFREA